MSEIKLEQATFNEPEKEEKEYHYVGVMFEDKVSSTKENPKFRGKVYEYKTKKDLKEGQVMMIPTRWGVSKVCIIKENIPEEELEFKEKDKIVEL